MEEPELELFPILQQDQSGDSDSLYRFSRIVVASFILQFFNGAVFYSVAGLLVPAVANHFKTEKTEAGMVIAVQFTVYGLMGPVAAIIIRAWGHAVATYIGALLFIIGFIGAGLSVHVLSLPLLYLSLGVLVGMGLGLYRVVSVDVLPYYFGRNLGVVIGIAMSGTGFGQVLSAPLFQSAVEIYGLSNALAILASTFTLCILSGWFISQEDEKPFNHLVSRDCKDDNSTLHTYKEIFTSPQLLLLFGYTTLIGMSIDSGVTFNVDRAIFHGLEEIHVAYILGACGLLSSLSKITVGKIVDAFRSRLFSITTLLMLVHALIFASSDYFRTLFGQAIWFAIFSITTGAYASTTPIIIRILAEDKMTECFGLWHLTWGLAGLVGSAIIGPSFDAFGSYRLGYFIVGFFSLFGTLMLPCVYIIKARNNNK